MDLELGRLSWCNHKGPYRREAGGLGWVVDDVRMESTGAWLTMSQGVQEAGKGKEMDSPLKSLEGMQPCWWFTFIFFIFIIYLFFKWRIIALLNFVVFCQISTWLSHRYTYVSSLLSSLPSLSPSHPFRLIQSPCLSSLSHTANCHLLSILDMVM